MQLMVGTLTAQRRVDLLEVLPDIFITVLTALQASGLLPAPLAEPPCVIQICKMEANSFTLHNKVSQDLC